MTELHKIVLMGASGVLGKAILQALLSSNDFEITVLTRPTSQATFPSTVRVIRTTYDQANLTEAFATQDAVICATHLSTIPDQKAYIQACAAAGVSRFITNDYGNADDFQGLPELEFARKPKQEILAYVQGYVRDNPSSSSSLTWTALATGHFLDYALTKFPAAFGFSITERAARLVDGGVEPFSATTLADIGRAVVGILRRPAETANRYLLVRTLETTQLEVLRALEEQTATKWEVEHVSSAVLYQRGKRMVEQGDRGAVLQLLPVQIFEAGAGRYAFPPDRYDNALLGLRERSINEVVHDVVISI